MNLVYIKALIIHRRISFSKLLILNRIRYCGNHSTGGIADCPECDVLRHYCVAINNLQERTGGGTVKREIWLDQLKGVAIFMVVYGHGIQYLMGDGYVFWDNRIFQVIYSFHMGLFMMISGYFFFPFSQKYSFLDGISRKVNTILIPCLTWGGDNI